MVYCKNNTLILDLKVSILIQARLSSQRLPGKILYKLGGSNYNSLLLIAKRLETLRDAMEIVVLTSREKCDDAIEFFANKNKIKCFRGSHKDVLQRYFDCSTYLKSNTIIRLTSDCPFIDPNEIKRVLEIHNKNNNDYTTNTFEGSTIVDGFDVEIFSYEALKRAAKEAFLPSHREHVTFYFKKENNFKIEYTDPKLDFPYTRLTLDTPEDYESISKLIEKIDDVENCQMREIVSIFYKYEFNKINSKIVKNLGWVNSLIEDEAHNKKNKKD